jgi:hypothetical protein
MTATDPVTTLATSTEQAQQIGVSRPPLEVVDLPSPEEVFKVKRVGLEEVILFVIGPSLIALGVSIGSGEWISGPLAVSKSGFIGIGWVILVSAILQVFYNVELARFTVATGEVPVVAFGRLRPGFKVWSPLALLLFFAAFILGSWAVSAGQALYALFTGQAAITAGEIEMTRVLGIGALLTTFLFVSIGRRIERTLELVQGIFVIFILVSLMMVTLTIVPFDYWSQAVSSLVILAPPPAGVDPNLLGQLVGFTALAAGLNFMFIGYYRDKGYGMGHRVGFLSGWFGGRPHTLSPVGKVFPANELNAARWRRWFRYLLIDQWGVYFVGALIGMLMPSILVGYLSSTTQVPPTNANATVYAAVELGKQYGPLLFSWALLMGFIILYTTQMIVLELLTRNTTDVLFANSRRFRGWVRDDTRRFYYPFMLVLVVVIGIIIHLGDPGVLRTISGNLSNLAALIFPLIMIYLNRQLPRPARATWWSNLVLILNVLFFGFFFVNFLAVQLTGQPLVRL